MSRTPFLFAGMLTVLCASVCPAESVPPIKAADYPRVSLRTAFFEDRINAKNPATRRRVLLDVSYSYHVPDADYIAFLKRLLRDPDLSLRGQALQTLYGLWAPIDPKELPRQFVMGIFQRQIDLDDPATIPTLRKECERGTEQASDAVVVLGLLRHKSAIPLLKALTKDKDAPFVTRYAAARALLACGDQESARPAIEDMVRSQLAPYIMPPTIKVEKFDNNLGAQWEGPKITASGPLPVPYYALLACRAMIEIGPKDKPRGLEKLITLLGYLERSRTPNDQVRAPYVKELLAVVTGEYFESHAKARQWYAATYGKEGAARPVKAPARIKAADYPSVARRVAFFEARINANDPEIRTEVLRDLSLCYYAPDDEYIGLLKRLLKDSAPAVRGKALLHLHGLGVPIDPGELPRQFTGYGQWQLIDRDKPSTVPDLLRACQEPGAEAGHAAYVLGLLRDKKALPALRKLASHPSIFVRDTAARALLDCGDRESARAILAEIIRSQLALYAAPPRLPPSQGKEPPPQRPMSPCYAVAACRQFTELGPKEKQVGLDKFITLLSFLERSGDVNDETMIPYAKRDLAILTGRYFDSSAEARKWYKENYPPEKSKPQPSP
jgi:HEAT repeat protein